MPPILDLDIRPGTGLGQFELGTTLDLTLPKGAGTHLQTRFVPVDST